MNVVLILSDQHAAGFTGCYGSAIARTPNIDSLAGRGARFDAAISPCPLCVPARSAMFTGRYAHELGLFENAISWNGTPSGYVHCLRDAGVHVTSIGKLDFTPGGDHGFTEEIFAKHRKQSWVDVTGAPWSPHTAPRVARAPGAVEAKVVRAELPVALAHADGVSDARLFREVMTTAPADGLHPTLYADERVAELTEEWIANHRPTDRPWMLNVNFFKPHAPLHPPLDIWRHYDARLTADDLGPRYRQAMDDLPPHYRARAQSHGGQHFSLEDTRRAQVGYYGTIECVDRNVGRVLAALERAGVLDETLVLYTCDHGDAMGAHRLLAKTNLYDDALRVPLLAAGPGVRPSVLRTPVSLLDIWPTVLEAMDVPVPPIGHGRSFWWQLAGAPEPPDRAIFCEAHSKRYPSSLLAMRTRRWKYVEPAGGHRPMLFDLQNDPDELDDLLVNGTPSGDAAGVADQLREQLHAICAPDTVDAEHRRYVQRFGGE